MPALKNTRHEAFAQHRASGASADEAYSKAGFSPDRGAASRLSANISVQERIAELQNQTARKASMTRADLVDWCERVLRAKPSEASADSDICQTVMTKAGPFTLLCDKGGAFDRLVKLCGWNEPEKHEHSGTVNIRIGGDDQH